MGLFLSCPSGSSLHCTGCSWSMLKDMLFYSRVYGTCPSCTVSLIHWYIFCHICRKFLVCTLNVFVVTWNGGFKKWNKANVTRVLLILNDMLSLNGSLMANFTITGFAEWSVPRWVESGHWNKIGKHFIRLQFDIRLSVGLNLHTVWCYTGENQFKNKAEQLRFYGLSAGPKCARWAVMSFFESSVDP